MSSPATDRFRRWLDATVDASPLRRFRFGFALVWFAYDALDLAYRGTARCSAPFAAQFLPLSGLVNLQSGLLAAELLLLTGYFARPLLLLAALLRGAEAFQYLRLNDFYYFSLTALLLSMSDCGRDDKVAHRWIHDVLRWQTGWVYLATALMKCNPEFLHGGHLYVREHYNMHALHWPYPAIYQRCMDSMACNSALSWGGVLAELSLGALLLTGKQRWAAVALACGIHTFGALATNVWFFGPSIVLQVYFAMVPLEPVVVEEEPAKDEEEPTAKEPAA